MKVLNIGHVTYDIIMQTKTFPKENTRNEVSSVEESGGGCAANTACLLGSWQNESYIAGVIGYDSYSDKIKNEFAKFNVKTDYLEIDYEGKTPINYIILNNENASRTILKQNIAQAPIKKSEYTNIGIDVLMLDSYQYETALKTLKAMPNVLSILDASKVTKEVLDLCSKVNIIICSKEFAVELSKTKIDENDPSTYATMYQVLKNKFPKQEIIVTLEEKGALYSFENHIKMLPAMNVDAKDTTGAGDIFHGAFAHQYFKTKNIEVSVKFANIAAGLSTRYVGIKQSIPHLDEVERYYEQV